MFEWRGCSEPYLTPETRESRLGRDPAVRVKSTSAGTTSAPYLAYWGRVGGSRRGDGQRFFYHACRRGRVVLPTRGAKVEVKRPGAADGVGEGDRS
jgi:hypothetical protein